MSDRVSPYGLVEGQSVRLEWSPYEWAMENEGHESGVVVQVRDVFGTQEPKHMCDISLESVDGEKYTHYVDNGYISGRSEATSGVPDRTDVGRFRGYYAVDEEEER